ncbi:MAG: GDSL-type esterase/lipase family protein [Terrimicrobiaceae bacterium]
MISVTRAVSFGLWLIALEALGAQSAGASYPLRDAVAFNGRDDLPNFFSKLNDGGKVKIAYLGGSITEQPGWRVKSRIGFQAEFPKAQVEEINAAIGGTGSELGVFRVGSDVLEKEPDLLFVEFAVNDRGAAPDAIRKAMEGIIRKTWKARPDCDICFIYTVTKDDIEGLKAGKMTRSESVMEEVADHYGISSINLGIGIARLERDGKLVMSGSHRDAGSGDILKAPEHTSANNQAPIVFSRDGIHPYLDTGHSLYAMAISRAMESIRWMGKPGSHELAAPLDRDNWEEAAMFALDQGGSLEGEVTKLDPARDGLAAKFGSRVPGLWEMRPGATLRFKFKGSKAAIYDVMGPDCGFVEVTLDGNSQKVARFDSYSTCHRLSVLKIGDNLEEKEHEVRISVLSDHVDKDHLVPEAGRKDVKESSAKYEGSNWYAGAILLVGNL